MKEYSLDWAIRTMRRSLIAAAVATVIEVVNVALFSRNWLAVTSLVVCVVAVAFIGFALRRLLRMRAEDLVADRIPK